jgi:hypothetical protein
MVRKGGVLFLRPQSEAMVAEAMVAVEKKQGLKRYG